MVLPGFSQVNEPAGLLYHCNCPAPLYSCQKNPADAALQPEGVSGQSIPSANSYARGLGFVEVTSPCSFCNLTRSTLGLIPQAIDTS